MALRHAVLAALLEGEASGYQLSKRFDVSVANFWSATPQQLYRELERLAQPAHFALSPLRDHDLELPPPAWHRTHRHVER